MRLLKINKRCISDGPGIRVSIYCSGCRNHCKGCHNPETWNFDNGELFDEYKAAEVLQAVDKSYISGITYCGGDPMEPENQMDLLILSKVIKDTYGDKKSIWLYTGYEWETIKDSELIKYIDVAVVGPFILEQRDISDENRWRGSRNQRVVDVQASLKQNKQINLESIPNNN